MFLFLLSYFTEAVTEAVTAAEKAVTESTDAYHLAGVSLALVGVSEPQAYQACPEMNPRTVRRVLAGRNDAVRMYMSVSSEEALVHKDSNENAVLIEVQQLAERAKVRPQVAISAITRYLNAPERVSRVLTDLDALVQAGCKVWNPTGLFTRLMRSGLDVKLPERVKQVRQATESYREAAEAKPEPQVGMLIRFCGEVCRIVGLRTQFVEAENPDGCVMNVSRDSLRFI